MKQFFLLLCLFSFKLTLGQEKTHVYSVDLSYSYGNIARHNNSMAHLITGHPEGVFASISKETFGYEEWAQRYNFPDYGLTINYQELKNEALGDNFGLYAHYSFYFFKRNLMMRIGSGIAYATNPYDKVTNNRNNAFGSTLLPSTFLMLNYKKNHIFKNFGLQGGLTMIHYSNGNTKAPNTSINIIALNLGVNYDLSEEKPAYQHTLTNDKFTEPIKLNLAFRSGVNSSDNIGSGQFPFYIFSAYADKRINHVSALQLGGDAFLSTFLQEYVKYRSIAYPEESIKGDEDYKRFGVFVGHELFINKLSFVTQAGYYYYNPVHFESDFYQRLGLKYYISPKVFGAVTLKTHMAKAEAIEFGIGVRL
ncbi:Lipid A 3-O-deacylase (PagL) [Pustulibacterium marinum]|uniref:Lipid A 3-O-deacylase (PagL) n=1 Tax=Pustulibacterium marinum TaxID=1224947 RepID=A0A1I7GNN8_9FLAO|nr:acyloxyacyl hydrolase [Pustulibacterium marinum]SFU50047.1 Lipid A 3-O-deacylase (PagL) [Pustulibacterium marinum]